MTTLGLCLLTSLPEGSHKPRRIIHNAISLDGRMDRLNVELGPYYRLAINMDADAILSGSSTGLAVEEPIPEEIQEDVAPEIDPGDERPLFVVPDSKGSIIIWHWLRKQPYWRDVVVLFSNSTPNDNRDYLMRLGVQYIITGEEKVSLQDALEELSRKFDVEKVRVDGGGTLNGILLRQGLVDEISVLIHPYLIGGFSPSSLFKAPDLESEGMVIPLRLKRVERMKGGLVLTTRSSGIDRSPDKFGYPLKPYLGEEIKYPDPDLLRFYPQVF